MANMFWISFALTSFIILGVSSQTITFSILSTPDDDERASLFSQFHHSLDNPDRSPLLSSNQLDPSEFDQDQLTSVSCYRVRANIKNAYPSDNTKYFICRDESSYEMYTCLNGGIFDEREKACIDLCEQTKPCLNQGQCIILPNLALQCVCRRDWTGERCETPVSTCANNPCGPTGECRMLNTQDYSQDYVCICNNEQNYGRNCQQTVPNPCLARSQQFHPFAYSRRAYINCDGESIFFQPCNSLLYWNQEAKRCDRSLPELLRTPFVNVKQPNKQNDQIQFNAIGSTQWPRNGGMQQQMISDQQGQWQQTNIEDNQEQNFPSLPQRMNTQQWSNQIPNMRMQTNQRFVSQTQSSQGQNQPASPNTFMETTTTAPPLRVFRLQGFSSRNSGEDQQQWKNQMPTSTDLKTQSVDQPQSWQDSSFMNNQQPSQMQFPMQQNMQFGSNQRTGQMPTSADKAVPQGVITHTLLGWKSNQQEPSNSMNEKPTLNSMPTFQLKSWKS